MASITKYRCDFCGKEVEDTYMEAGWLKFQGAITRSWGIRGRDGRGGDAMTDYISGQSEFCSIKCLIGRLDMVRAKNSGSKTPESEVVPDPFPFSDMLDPEPKKPWEDPLPDESTEEEPA